MTRVYIGRLEGHGPSPKYCAAAVHDQFGVEFHQCGNRPKIRRVIENKEYGFCRLHDPVVVSAKRVKRQKDLNAKILEDEARYAGLEQQEKYSTACISAIERIAAGHNDPSQLARECLKLKPAEVK